VGFLVRGCEKAGRIYHPLWSLDRYTTIFCVLTLVPARCTLRHMASTYKVSAASGIRFSVDDRKIIGALSKKLGVGMAQIVRMGIRALATKEGVQA
jgi:hypothetical protein